MKKLLCSAAVVGVLAVPGLLSGQVEISPQLNFADDVDFGVGGSVAFPLESLHEAIEAFASFDLFFPDGFDYWEIDALLRYKVELANPGVLPFVSAGIAIASFSFDTGGITIPGGFGFDGSTTEFGLKVGGGAKFNPDEAITPWADLHFGLGDIPSFTLRVGAGFTVGG